MITALVLDITAFVIIFIEAEGYSKVYVHYFVEKRSSKYGYG